MSSGLKMIMTGDVAKKVYAGDLKSPDFNREGSNPSVPSEINKG